MGWAASLGHRHHGFPWCQYRRLDEKELYGRVADELAAGKVVGWHQGRNERLSPRQRPVAHI
jgi:predicted NodU family carbamoyl transferase